ncbi:MAG TPA: hypothetical protein VIM63_07810, partial [Rhodoferax sp.]
MGELLLHWLAAGFNVRQRTDLVVRGASTGTNIPEFFMTSLSPTPSSPAYGFHCELTGLGFDQAVIRVAEALKAEGFGVLRDIEITKLPFIMSSSCPNGVAAYEDKHTWSEQSLPSVRTISNL